MNNNVRAYTWRDWKWIAVVLPNNVVFLKKKATGEWHRRQKTDYVMISDTEAREEQIDSLWGINGVCQDPQMEEIPAEAAADLWEQCKVALGISSIDEIKLTERVWL